jgi:hypothetical protein
VSAGQFDRGASHEATEAYIHSSLSATFLLDFFSDMNYLHGSSIQSGFLVCASSGRFITGLRQDDTSRKSSRNVA